MRRHFELENRKTIFYLPNGSKLYGPRQPLGSLYKEFVVDDKVHCFYLHQANNEAFIYKLIKTRKIEYWDRKIGYLMGVVS